MTRLPPLRSLQVFDSAARNLNFSLAASELSITQAAVSKQIKLLENFYSENLFLRNGTLISLTSKGVWLANRLEPIFDQLSELGKYKNSEIGKIRLAASSYLSINLLGEIIEEFNSSFDHQEVELILSDRKGVYGDELADVFITDCDCIDGYYCRYLFSEYLVPAASPYVLGTSSILNVSDLTGYTLLGVNYKNESDWNNWFKYSGEKPAKYQRCKIFSHPLLLRQSVEKGRGLALLRSTVDSPENFPFGLTGVSLPSAPSGSEYHICCKVRRRYEPGIKFFIEWLAKYLANKKACF